MINTTIRGGTVTAKRPIAGTPVHKQILDYIDKARMTQLMPDRRGQVVAQSSDQTKLQVQGVGETAADGHDYSVCVPYITPQMLDSQGQPFPGGPAAGDDIFIRDISRGNPVILGQRISSPQPSPFVSGVKAGNGIASSAYADPNVLNPTISIQTKGLAQSAGVAGGLKADTTGLGISLGSSAPLTLASGLDVVLASNTPLTSSASGLDVGIVSGSPLSKSSSGLDVKVIAGSPITKSSSGLDVTVDNSTIKKTGSQLVGGYVAGTGVSIVGNTITNTAAGTSYSAGTGISISGTTISVNLTAGTGISISGGTITNAHTAGTGISISGNAISVSLTAGNGIAVSGAAVSARLGAALSFDAFGQMQVNPNGSGALSTSVGLAVKVDGTTIGINGSNQLFASATDPRFGSGYGGFQVLLPVSGGFARSNDALSVTIGGVLKQIPLI